MLKVSHARVCSFYYNGFKFFRKHSNFWIYKFYCFMLLVNLITLIYSFLRGTTKAWCQYFESVRYSWSVSRFW